MQPAPNPIVQIIPLFFLLGVFYFFLIRPQQKKQKEHQLMLTGLKKNDEVVTAGGVHGTIINVKDRTFVLRIDEASKVEIDKTAISYIKKQRA